MTQPKAKTFKGTWLGRPGRQTTYNLPGGLRVLEHQWADEATCRVTVSAGDFRVEPGRPGAGVLYLEVEGVEPGQGAALAASLC